MASWYYYDIWDGEKVIGRLSSMFRLYIHCGETTIQLFCDYSGKNKRGKRGDEDLTVPLIMRTVYDDGVEVRQRLTLDVRKKSKRQIQLLLDCKKVI